MNRKTYPMPGRGGSFVFCCARGSLVAVGVALLAACQTNGVSNFDLFGTPQKIVVGEDVVLPRSSGALSRTRGVASTIRIVVELDQQKRFAEARHLLSQVRTVQPSKSEGYRSVTNSMAALALKEGKFEDFKRLARQLDSSLGNPVRVKAPHTEIITLYRAVRGKPLPVNAPANMKSLKDKYAHIQNAKLQRRDKR
jgi:hypothetical protein